MYKIEVLISQKESVIDPVAQAIQEAVNAMTPEVYSEFHTKKIIEFTVQAKNQEEAERLAKELSEKVLVNDAMENYELLVKEAR